MPLPTMHHAPSHYAPRHPPFATEPQGIVSEHSGDRRWGPFAQRILSGELWRQPRAGGHDDKAHPPIHPTKHTEVRRRGGQDDVGGEAAGLHEFPRDYFCLVNASPPPPMRCSSSSPPLGRVQLVPRQAGAVRVRGTALPGVLQQGRGGLRDAGGGGPRR